MRFPIIVNNNEQSSKSFQPVSSDRVAGTGSAKNEAIGGDSNPALDRLVVIGESTPGVPVLDLLIPIDSFLGVFMGVFRVSFLCAAGFIYCDGEVHSGISVSCQENQEQARE